MKNSGFPAHLIFQPVSLITHNNPRNWQTMRTGNACVLFLVMPYFRDYKVVYKPCEGYSQGCTQLNNQGKFQCLRDLFLHRLSGRLKCWAITNFLNFGNLWLLVLCGGGWGSRAYPHCQWVQITRRHGSGQGSQYESYEPEGTSCILSLKDWLFIQKMTLHSLNESVEKIQKGLLWGQHNRNVHKCLHKVFCEYYVIYQQKWCEKGPEHT